MKDVIYVWIFQVNHTYQGIFAKRRDQIRTPTQNKTFFSFLVTMRCKFLPIGECKKSKTSAVAYPADSCVYISRVSDTMFELCLFRHNSPQICFEHAR